MTARAIAHASWRRWHVRKIRAFDWWSCRGISVISSRFPPVFSTRAGAILDGDLQDPPEALLEFHCKLSQGYDVVYAVRRRRKEVWPKRLAYWAFYRLLRSLASIDVPLDSGDFCMLSRRVVRRINALPERHRFVRGLRSWVGFRQTGLEYERAARGAGESKYTFRKLFGLACDGVFSFSDAPLRIA